MVRMKKVFCPISFDVGKYAIKLKLKEYYDIWKKRHYNNVKLGKI